MTDKELMELAAKAAGLHIALDENGTATEFFCEAPKSSAFSWNPLTDDGDALRLAVKLKLCVDFEAIDVVKVYYDISEPSCKEGLNCDQYAATRRAIVHAAAEIGAQMK